MLETENEYFTDLIDYLSKNNKSKNWQKYLAGKEVLADWHYYEQAKEIRDLKAFIAARWERLNQ